MKSVKRTEIHPVKMASAPPESVVNAGMKVINTDGFVYLYVGTGWVRENKATSHDRQNIPQLL